MVFTSISAGRPSSADPVDESPRAGPVVSATSARTLPGSRPAPTLVAVNRHHGEAAWRRRPLAGTGTTPDGMGSRRRVDEIAAEPQASACAFESQRLGFTQRRCQDCVTGARSLLKKA